jgi:hypothetical protein
MLALVAGSMSVAVAGAYAAAGSPADTDKAGRMGPGTAAGQMGAADPTPGKAGASGGAGMSKSGSAGAGTSTGAGTSAGAGSAGAASSSTGSNATTGSTTSGSSATAGSGMGDDGKAKRSRRAARASKG